VLRLLFYSTQLAADLHNLRNYALFPKREENFFLCSSRVDSREEEKQQFSSTAASLIMLNFCIRSKVNGNESLSTPTEWQDPGKEQQKSTN
jgi:hypothetical protein